MSKAIDVFLSNSNRHIGRIVFSESAIEVLTPRDLRLGMKQELMDFLKECAENGVNARWGKKVGDCYVDGVKRITSKDIEFPEAVRDSINDGLMLCGKRVFAIPAKAVNEAV